MVFDDGSLVADAGLVAAGVLMGRLGLASLVDATVRLGRRVGAAAPAAAMLVGATHIDRVGRLRAGATGAVLGFRPAAPSTVGVLLRSLTWGRVRRLDKAAGLVVGRAWSAGAGPGADPVAIDVDSTVCEVSGAAKAGAARGHTEQLGCHPLAAVRADTGEVLHARLRNGPSQNGNAHFVAETVARARRAGAAGALCARADSGFFSHDLVDRLDAPGVRWSITIPQYGHAKAAAGAVADDDWAPIAYPAGGEARVAETTILAGRRGNKRKIRVVVRPSRLTGQTQAELWPHWRYHAFATNRTDHTTAAADKLHRQHAGAELAIGDLKESTGPAHLPAGHFAANAAWLVCATPAHNPYRRLGQRGKVRHNNKLTVGRTDRNHLLALPGRLVNHAGRTILRLPPPMAPGDHPPHRTHQHPRPPPTLLNPQTPRPPRPPTGPERPEPANTGEPTPATTQPTTPQPNQQPRTPTSPPQAPTNTHPHTKTVDPG